MLARFGVCDLVRLELHTGRTHQIRVHLAHVGHPVVGDPVYSGGGARRMAGPGRQAADRLERATPRQALHAAELVFKHPITGARMAFASEWPADLRRRSSWPAKPQAKLLPQRDLPILTSSGIDPNE